MNICHLEFVKYIYVSFVTARDNVKPNAKSEEVFTLNRPGYVRGLCRGIYPGVYFWGIYIFTNRLLPILV